MKSKRPKLVVAVPDLPAPWWQHVVALVALLLASGALYHGALDLGFLSLDDPDYVQNNPRLDSLSRENLRLILTQPWFANYAPLHLLSYALDVALAGGKSAIAMHGSNLIWYAWGVAMVYLLAFTLRPCVLTAAGAAALFLAHPAHVEVVAWISSRKDLIATGFAALSATCYLLYRRQTKAAWGWYAGSVAAFFLASAAKQSVVLLPGVYLLWDLLVERRRHWSMITDKLLFGLITVFFALQTMGAQPETRRDFSFLQTTAVQLWNLWLLTGLGDYVVYRPAPDPILWNPEAKGIVSVVALLFWLVPLAFLKQSRPLHLVLYGWMLVQMTPPMVMRFTNPVTDRYLFLPSVGLCILLADLFLGDPARRPFARRVLLVILLGLAGLWGYRTWSYLQEWRDPRSLWYGASQKSSAYQVFQFIGEIYQDAGDRMNDFITAAKPLDMQQESALARRILGDASRVEALQQEWQTSPPAKTNSVSYRNELWHLAWEKYGEAVKRRGTLSAPNLFLRRGKLLVSQGKYDEAIADLTIALAFAETSSYFKVRQENGTHISRAIGIAYWNLRKYPEALQWYIKAQRIQQESGQVWISTLDSEMQRLRQHAGNP